MDVIEKYLYAIGKRLPLKQREDIVKELRSVIMDNLDDRVGDSEPTEEDINQVLLEMGSPYEVAKRYRTHGNYLIGPNLIEPFFMVLKVVLIAVIGGHLISIIISLLANGTDIGDMAGHIVTRLWSIIPSIFTAAGAIVLVFVIIDRAGGKKTMGLDEFTSENWHPSKLEDVPQKEEIVKPIESIIGIVITLIAIIVFNFYKTKLGIYYTQDGTEQWIMVGLNKLALEAYVPIWTVSWTLSLALHAWLLGVGKYTTNSRIFELFIGALNVGILFFMANGPVLFDINNGIMELKVIIDFVVNNHHTIFIVLGVLTLLGFLANLGKFIIARIKAMNN